MPTRNVNAYLGNMELNLCKIVLLGRLIIVTFFTTP